MPSGIPAGTREPDTITETETTSYLQVGDELIPIPDYSDRGPHRRGHKRTPDERDRDLRIIAEMWVQGFSQREISRRFGLSAAQIRRDIKKVREDWREATFESLEQSCSQEIARIDAVMREAWTSWRASKETKEKKVRRALMQDGQQRGKEKVEITTETTPGDAAFLKIIIDCIERRTKLLGLDKPIRHEVSGPNQSPIAIEKQVNFDALSDAEINALANILTTESGASKETGPPGLGSGAQAEGATESP